jgi:cell division protein FtsQ
VQQPLSPEQLKQRRRQLRRQQRIRVIKSLWRFGCMCGILTGVAWVAQRRGDWTIATPEQIRIEGNQYLTDRTIRSMLAVKYPQSIVELAPASLTEQMLERGSIASARIDRGVLPPHLLVQVRDLPPVARIMQDETTESQLVVDERGRQQPISSYRDLVQQSLPKLRLRLPARGECPGWQQLYQAIRTSPVTIGIVDCRNPQNLILQSEVGKVRLGSSGEESRLSSQIQQLDRLRNWRNYTDPLGVDYIDLGNPNAPRLQLK